MRSTLPWHAEEAIVTTKCIFWCNLAYNNHVPHILYDVTRGAVFADRSASSSSLLCITRALDVVIGGVRACVHTHYACNEELEASNCSSNRSNHRLQNSMIILLALILLPFRGVWIPKSAEATAAVWSSPDKCSNASSAPTTQCDGERDAWRLIDILVQYIILPGYAGPLSINLFNLSVLITIFGK